MSLRYMYISTIYVYLNDILHKLKSRPGFNSLVFCAGLLHDVYFLLRGFSWRDALHEILEVEWLIIRGWLYKKEVIKVTF